eukprot:2776340-Rhodomonas_salina.1
MPQQDRHEGQLACGDSNRSSDLPPCSTLATTMDDEATSRASTRSASARYSRLGAESPLVW